MPRLLLVDDNPSIHRIAESLLAPTDVVLVCAASASEALACLEGGERFDVALVDTAMPGMDGWALVGRLRALEATAAMPIALMAGVLDPVDPVRLASAPVQGFLKKPIELRELGDRVKALMALPVEPPSPSPFKTVPATPARELLERAEAALPEFRALPEPEGLPAEDESDVLILTAEDVWAEEPVAGLEDLPEVSLELEDLDLGNLPPEPPAAPGPEADLLLPLPDPSLAPLPDLDELDLEMPSGVEAVPGDAGVPFAEAEAASVAVPAPEADGALDLAALDDLLPPPVEPVQAALEAPLAGLPEPAPLAAEGQGPAVLGQLPPPGPAAAGEDQARAVVQAILADPVLVDALVKAVVARMGDQVIREIAWEVIPDLAGKLHP